MKKTLAIILALVLALGLTVSAMADESWPTLKVEVFDRDTAGLDVANGWQHKYAQEHFGDPNQINLEFVGYSRWGGEEGLIAADLTAHIAPDICITYNNNKVVDQYIEFEGIWQLNDLLETAPNLKAFLTEEGDELLKLGQRDGIQWHLNARRISRANVGFFIREDWLKELGMEKPTSIEQLTAYLEAAQEKKLGGDNTVAFSFGIYESDPMFNVARITNAFVDFSKVTEEDWFAMSKNPEMLPGAKEGFRWLNKLYNEGIISESFALQNNDDATDSAMVMGSIGFFNGQPDQPWRTDKNYQKELEKNVEGGHWVSCSPFVNESLGKALRDVYTPAGLLIFIPKDSDEAHAQMAMKYLDWLATPENLFAMQNGTEGINYESLNEDGIPVGVKANDEVPDENKIHAGDIAFIANGLYYGSAEKNEAALVLPFAGYEDDVREAYKDSLTDTWTQIGWTVPIQALTDYEGTVKGAEAKFIADVVSCSPEEFDAKYDAGIEEIKAAGADEIIAELRQNYQAGNYTGTYPGN